jgi:hypothetical protein
MSFSIVPVEINTHIVNFFQPTTITSKEIKKCAHQIKDISLINKEFSEICHEKLANLKKINILVNKYHEYNDRYEKALDNLKGKKPKGNPHLLDALFTECGLPHAESSFKIYTTEIENDIKEIVKLTPQNMECTLGKLRCRKKVSPLVAACMNKNIPVSIIEFLLQRGANPNATLRLERKDISILLDLKNHLEIIGKDRLETIEKLFKKYGAV